MSSELQSSNLSQDIQPVIRVHSARSRLNVNARPFVISPASGFNPLYNPRVDSIERPLCSPKIDFQSCNLEHNSKVDKLAEFLFEHKEDFQKEQEYIQLMDFLKTMRK